MEILLTIRTAKSESWAEDVSNSLRKSGIEIRRSGHSDKRGAHVRGLTFPSEIIVALGSAGAFTAFYKVIRKLLEANKDRGVEFIRKGIKVSIKGHSLPEEKELLETLVPEFIHGNDDSTSGSA